MYARDYVKQILSQHGIFATAECLKLEEKPPGHCTVLIWLDQYAWSPIITDDMFKQIISHMKLTCGIKVYSIQVLRKCTTGYSIQTHRYENPAVSRCES